MTGSVTGIRRRRTVAGRRETSHLPPDRAFYGQTLCIFVWRAVLKTVILQRVTLFSIIYRIIQILHFSPHSLPVQAPEGLYLL